jgi:CheY-specific phosphatase CheX
MTFNPEHVDFVGLHVDEESINPLIQYLKHQRPEVLSRVAQTVSPEIKQIISQNVQGLIGVLPADGFSVQVTTDRDNLAGLLASAMMTGYFLRQMEQRMQMEVSLTGSLSLEADED